MSDRELRFFVAQSERVLGFLRDVSTGNSCSPELRSQAFDLHRKFHAILRESGMRAVSKQPTVFKLQDGKEQVVTFDIREDICRVMCQADGSKIQAIKMYRERSGLGLREAKEVVDAIYDESIKSGMFKPHPEGAGRLVRIDPTYTSTGPNGLITAFTTKLPVEGLIQTGVSMEMVVETMLTSLKNNGNKIDAIKEARQVSGLGLKEAKDLVEEFMDHLMRYEGFTRDKDGKILPRKGMP